jgi:hypothetical protein
MEKALFLYRISLLKFEAEKDKQMLDSLKLAISRDKEQLDKYSAIVEQLKEIRK